MAAQASDGTRLAYPDPLLGFVGLTVVTGAIIAAVGSRFWKERRGNTVFILGAVQAILGLLVYIQRFSVHG